MKTFESNDQYLIHGVEFNNEISRSFAATADPMDFFDGLHQGNKELCEPPKPL